MHYAVTFVNSAIDALPSRFVIAFTADMSSSSSSSSSVSSVNDRRRQTPQPTKPKPAPLPPHDYGLTPPGFFDALLIVTLLLLVVTIGFCHMMCLQTPTQFVMPSKNKLKSN